MSFYPKTHYDVQIVGLGNNNFREIDNGYYGYRINTADKQRSTQCEAGAWPPYASEIPIWSHVAVHSPQTTYLDPINPGSSYPAPRRA